MALAVAFDPAGDYGVAVGEQGYGWSSDDGGARWRVRLSGGCTGARYTRAWVRRRTCVIRDAAGAVWISRDGGFAIESTPFSAEARVGRYEVTA